MSLEHGDTVASALFRAGVRVFNRSLKHHRRRGLYCLTGDCPNCMCNVDGEPGVRSCTTPAHDGMKVKRETGFPSPDRDLLAIADRMHTLMPVGFYYKAFVRPRFAWALAEKVIRRTTGVGRLPLDRAPRMKEMRHVRCDVLVVGGGIAGLAAAVSASGSGRTVVLCEEGAIGESVSPGPTLDRIHSLEAQARSVADITIFERHAALGVYEGPLVPVVGEDALLEVDPGRIVVATGAVETHPVFPGNDLPGVWLGRGAARMAGVHSVRPGLRAVVSAGTPEALEHVRTLARAGVDIAAVAGPGALSGVVPDGITLIRDGRILAAEGRKAVRSVLVGSSTGERRVSCDTLVVSESLCPRDALLRMGSGLPVTGAGEVVIPGCSPDQAAESGAAAGRGDTAETREATAATPLGRGGYVCLCEDVAVRDLERAWEEGWRSSEILKRYTTATMGPCRGAMCGRHLSAFVAAGTGDPIAGARTTARPPARPVRLEDLAGGINEVIEKRTALHDRHIELGARVDWSGTWIRPFNYGDPRGETLAVHESVGIMDVGTLGKFLVAGRDATELLDRVYPCRIEGLQAGRSRYMLALDEAGYVMDDGLVCALGGGDHYVTSTSGGADRMEAWLRNWADRWDLHAHLVNQTSMLGAINVAGPRARELLAELSDDAIDAASFPNGSHRQIRVADVPCRALRVGFVGELSFELHHARSHGVGLWNALLEAGSRLGVRPHGMDSLEILRLEKAHVYLGQDTLPDDHPTKLGLDRTVAMDKPRFIGKMALERMAEIPLERKLVGLRLATRSPQRGVPLYAGDRIVGRVTSCALSDTLGHSIGLGWMRAVDGEFASALHLGDGVEAVVVPTPFYDPEGTRLRA